MTMTYFDRSRASDQFALPDCEIFYVNSRQAASNAALHKDEGCTEQGWYWWPCFPGCLPDGEPNGPFPTHAAALADARDNGDFDDDE